MPSGGCNHAQPSKWQPTQENRAPAAALFARSTAGPGVPLTSRFLASILPVIPGGIPFKIKPWEDSLAPPLMLQSSNIIEIFFGSVQPVPQRAAGDMMAPWSLLFLKWDLRKVMLLNSS